MSKKSTLIIANPASGRGKGKQYTPALLQALKERGIEAEVWYTTGRGHGEQLARQALNDSVDTVVACGGDGTTHEIVQALAGARVRLALAPAGRCNDFARVLGELPSPEQAAAIVANGKPRALDLVRAGDRYYCTVGAVGFDAEVSRRVDQSRLPLTGQPAYLLAVVQTLIGYEPAKVQMRWEGGRYNGPILLAAVGNTPTYGNNIPIVPQAKPDDGILDICMVQPAGFLRIVSLLPTLLKGAHAGLPEVSFISSPWVEISADKPMEIWAEGEPVGGCPVRIESVPNAITVLS